MLLATADDRIARPDVAATYGSPYFTDWYHAGWSAAVPLSPGPHTLLVRVVMVRGTEQEFPGNTIGLTVR